jgi:hypothetical protein
MCAPVDPNAARVPLIHVGLIFAVLAIIGLLIVVGAALMSVAP